MSEIGPKTFRTEQYEFEARVSDPANAEPGEYWIRTDQTSSNPDVIAELRRQDTSAVSKIPLFADSEESNLGSDVVRGPSVVLDNGSVGFVAMTTDSGAKFGSPRAVTAAGTEYLSHNSLTLTAVPNSVIAQFRGTTYAAGDTSWTDGASNASDQDATLTDNGLTEATASDGSEAIESGGSSYGDFTIPPELSGSSINNMAIELAVQYTSNNRFGRLFGCVNDNNSQAIDAFTDTDEKNNNDNGNIVFQITDPNGSLMKCAPTTNPNLDDGTRHDITLNVVDASNNNVDIIIDGVSQSLSFSSTGLPSNFSSWDQPMGLMGLDGGSNSKAGKYIAFRFHDSSTSQTIDKL